ncbi:MAG: helix-turn-helix domain-containing protein [Saprospiraceae bacterium]|nr:helix-turn-helix domain-containing protein [Saprospiraceae bacterium]
MLNSLVALSCLLLTSALYGQVTFLLEQIPANTPSGDTLFLASSINNWDAGNPGYQFRRNASGQHYLTLPERTEAFDYKITRGAWASVETDSTGGFVDNHRYPGGKKEDTIRLTIYTWDDLPINPRYGWLRIQVDRLPKNTPPDASIYAVGGFNNWNPSDPGYRMQKQRDGTFEIAIPLLSDTTFYKFTRGGWETIEGRRNGRARVNRQFIIKEDSSRNLRVQIESWEDLAGNPINVYTFFLLLAAIQGFLLILAINSLQNNNRAANGSLSILLLTLSVALAGRVSTYDREIFNWIPGLLLLPDFIYFLYAPIFLLYLNRLLRLPSRQNFGISWWHFVPFLIHLGVYMPFMLMPKATLISEVVNQNLKPFFVGAAGMGLIFNAIYWFVCRRAIRQYEQESGEKHAFEPNLAFLKVVMWLKALCIFIWAAGFCFGIADFLLEKDLGFLTDTTTDTLWMAFAFTAFILGYYTMRQPEIFKLPPMDATPTEQLQEEQEKAASMSTEELAAIKKSLEEVIKNNQPYRNPGLSLTDLAEMTGTSPHSLSRVINEGYGMNFNDFINAYRIEEFKRLVQLEEYRNQTLLAIAFAVGFNSKSAFNRSFKKLEDCTPREYLKGKVDLVD